MVTRQCRPALGDMLLLSAEYEGVPTGIQVYDVATEVSVTCEIMLYYYVNHLVVIRLNIDMGL